MHNRLHSSTCEHVSHRYISYVLPQERMKEGERSIMLLNYHILVDLQFDICIMMMQRVYLNDIDTIWQTIRCVQVKGVSPCTCLLFESSVGK